MSKSNDCLHDKWDASQDKCADCGVTADVIYDLLVQKVAEPLTKCQCGAEKIGLRSHSFWCDAHFKA